MNTYYKHCDIEQKLKKIISYFAAVGLSFNYNIKYLRYYEIYLNAIYDIYINKNLNTNNPLYYTHVGNEYYINNNFEMAEKYYSLAINNDNICLKNNFSILYYEY